MANFEGSIQEFHHFIGPKIKNQINNLTRDLRTKLKSKCEHCFEIKELESAHVHGKDRRSIIESVLRSHFFENLVRCDIQKVEDEIIRAHSPVRETFLFICKSCHVKYDSGNKREININKQKNNTVNLDNEFKKIGRIKLWAERQNQINHKIISIFILLEKKGPVSIDEFKRICTNIGNENKIGIPNFDGHYAAMKTDRGNSHGNVFYEENGIVKVWPLVRNEINKYFK